MFSKQVIKELVHATIDELNSSLGQRVQVHPTADTALYGENGQVDSIFLVSLIALVEEKIETNFGFELALTADNSLSLRHSPFRSIDSFVEYVLSTNRRYQGLEAQNA